MSVILFVANQSTHLTTKRMVLHDDGRVEEVEPPDAVPEGEVIVIRQLRVTGITDIIGAENIYQGTVFVGETVQRAWADARVWVDERSIDSDQA